MRNLSKKHFYFFDLGMPSRKICQAGKRGISKNQMCSLRPTLRTEVLIWGSFGSHFAPVATREVTVHPTITKMVPDDDSDASFALGFAASLSNKNGLVQLGTCEL
jgi:hypothetical protein